MMNTNRGFTEVTEEDITQALKKVLLPRMQEALEASLPGHCMRVTNLDLNLMTALCSDLRRTCPYSQVFILRDNKTIYNTSDPNMYVTSTKLVEQRNPLLNGEQRPPLLVFIPTDLRTSAEDSFGVATFADIPVGDAYDKQLKKLHEQEVPSLLQGAVQEIFSILTQEQWPWADVVTQVRYLLTATKNQVDGQTLGASLYELGLIPDFHLLDDPSLLTVKIRRNLEAVRIITYSSASTRGRVLELGLTDKSLQHRLLGFFSHVGVDDPSSWTRLIVLQKDNWDFSFDKWIFIDDIIHDKISIEVLPLNIPIAGEDDQDENLSGLNGQKVLNPNNQNKLQVTFRVDPLPFQVASLDYFTVQILTRNGEPVGSTKRIKAWKSKKPDQIVNLDKFNKIEWNDGWHLVRILAWTKEELPVPLDHRYVQGSDPRIRTNESEPFYVLQQGEIEDEAPRTPPQEYSLEHAKLRLQFKALSEERPLEDVMPETQLWTKKTNKTSRSKQAHLETLEVKFTHGERYRIYISRSLKEFEQKILSQPENPASWIWHIKTNMTSIAAPFLEHVDWPKSAAMENFLDARRSYFETIQAQVADKEGITQTADLPSLLDPCITYADAYHDLLTDLRYKIHRNGGIDQQKAIRTLRSVLAVDSIHVVLTDFRGCIREATLIAPTHPLRALWHINWAQVAQYWLHSTQQLLKANLSSVQENILRKLVPLNIPLTVPCTDGRVFTMVDMLNPFWSLYAPATEEDTRGLLSQICNILGLPEPAIGGETITSEVLAARMSRYIVQHPYIRTLKINTFNPGSATVLADALVQLQKQDPFSQLRYDIHLFVPDPTVPRIGEALELLLSPASTVNTEAVDAFSIPGNSHLFPKLSLAVHDTQNFITTPHKYRAHLSVLFDLFPAQEIGASPPLQTSDTAPLYGLVQDFRSDFQDTQERTFWRRQPRHGEPQTLPNLEHSINLLAALSHSLSGAISTVATGLPAFEQRPTFMIGLDMQQRELIHHIHEISDWVLTIDRNIGIEFFPPVK
jgi:hypothetical protein